MIPQLEARLLRRSQAGNLRQLRLTEPLVDFASNDYLGLARSPHLISEVHAAITRLDSLGSTGSRLLTGNLQTTQNLEDEIASFHHYQAGLLFNCGYMANVGLISAVCESNDTIFFDAHIHASMHDGIRLSRVQSFPFRHNDLSHLENRLKKCSARGRKIIAIESIYSADGSESPLVDICYLAKKYEANVIVDEAHAVGVCGPNGRGLVAQHGLINDVFAQVITFGKALGTFGAIVLGSDTLKRTLINFARSYMYTTALPSYAIEAIRCSYQVFPKLEAERESIKQLIQLFKANSQQASQTHIQSIKIKGNEAVQQMSHQLALHGFEVRSLMSPTVQRGHEVLRICLHAFNTENEVRRLLSCI